MKVSVKTRPPPGRSAALFIVSGLSPTPRAAFTEENQRQFLRSMKIRVDISSCVKKRKKKHTHAYIVTRRTRRERARITTNVNDALTFTARGMKAVEIRFRLFM